MLQIKDKRLQNFRNAELPKQERSMSDVTAAQILIQDTFPTSRYGNIKAATYAAYKQLGLATIRRAETIWYGIARRIDASELDALREEKARQEAHAQQIRLQETIAYLRQTDQDFYCAAIDALEHCLSSHRIQDRPMD